jgi:hypothetical protein
VIQHGGLVPTLLRKAEALTLPGEIGYIIKDISGCYPNMPKPEISLAQRDTVAELT